jgi:GntR family transcriptional regulator, transcriptional repressor for pyruvate dehydrogenase complex
LQESVFIQRYKDFLMLDLASSPTNNSRVNGVTKNALRKTRGLAHVLVDALKERIRTGEYSVGSQLPTEARIIAEFGVSRTVVRDAITRLQTEGMVTTKHGIGSFVENQSPDLGFRVKSAQLQSLREVISVLELRIGLETEAAALAAVRRNAENLASMRNSLDRLHSAVSEHKDAVEADYDFHAEIARATQNIHFASLFDSLGSGLIPRAKLSNGLNGEPTPMDKSPEQEGYLRLIQQEHENIFDAIAQSDSEAARAAMRIHLSNGRERRRKAAEALQSR